MIKEAIEKIENLVHQSSPVRFTLDEFKREHIITPNGSVVVKKNTRPQPETLKLNTLFGLCDLIKNEKLECEVHIEGPQSVSLITGFDEVWKLRDVYARATIADNKFPFGQQMAIEDFIISVQCYFVDTPEKKEVIDFVSSIFASDVQTAEDDGIAQNVVVESKVGRRKETARIDPIVKLRPWRTFREIEQPEDTFLIRAHRQKDSLPMISLRSAGGDLWKHAAIENIHSFLTGEDDLRKQRLLPEGISIIR